MRNKEVKNDRHSLLRARRKFRKAGRVSKNDGEQTLAGWGSGYITGRPVVVLTFFLLLASHSFVFQLSWGLTVCTLLLPFQLSRGFLPRAFVRVHSVPFTGQWSDIHIPKCSDRGKKRPWVLWLQKKTNNSKEGRRKREKNRKRIQVCPFTLQLFNSPRRLQT